MRVDFYQISSGTAEEVVPLLARATLQAGERLLVVAEDADQRGRIGTALWNQQAESFLANGEADGPHAERQPVLLSAGCNPTNGARYMLIADGIWRDEATQFERVLLVFGDDRLDETRAAWRSLDAIDGAERHFWKQDGGRWREGP